MLLKYKVERDFHNSRLDRWFKSNVISLPQSLLEKIIRKNKIRINNKKTKTSYRVQAGDIIEIYNISKFKSSNIIKPLNNSVENWTYTKLNETKKIAQQLKDKIKQHDFS